MIVGRTTVTLFHYSFFQQIYLEILRVVTISWFSGYHWRLMKVLMRGKSPHLPFRGDKGPQGGASLLGLLGQNPRPVSGGHQPSRARRCLCLSACWRWVLACCSCSGAWMGPHAALLCARLPTWAAAVRQQEQGVPLRVIDSGTSDFALSNRYSWVWFSGLTGLLQGKGARAGRPGRVTQAASSL